MRLEAMEIEHGDSWQVVARRRSARQRAAVLTALIAQLQAVRTTADQIRHALEVGSLNPADVLIYPLDRRHTPEAREILDRFAIP
ncbi:hypothetical protein [Actinokineospora spheciospongiae]|uniref:hypothetical protein n=1 Tax=Actinokineospora spheciospongiae TaxID=909613 RepID=UPI0015E87677|nr:hypothetical protein [Actinokineospora spheciospongiae]